MYKVNEWLSQAIRVTGSFIMWMALLLVAVAMVLLLLVVMYAVIKELVKNVKNGGKICEHTGWDG